MTNWGEPEQAPH